MIGCDYEAAYSDPRASRRALGEHLASAHGVGRIKGNEAHLGCFLDGCRFEVAGTVKFAQDELRAHLVAIHSVDPNNPEIPVEASRGAR